MLDNIKQQNLGLMNKQSKALLGVSGLLACSTLVLSSALLTKEEKWVVLPMASPDKRIELSSKGYGQVYLNTWASHVLETLLTCSKDTVEKQIEELRAISSRSSTVLESYFQKHIDFIKGSHISSVFFPKSTKVEGNAVTIRGLYRYWLGDEDKSHSLEKSYRLHYRQGARDVLLLDSIEEVADA